MSNRNLSNYYVEQFNFNIIPSTSWEMFATYIKGVLTPTVSLGGLVDMG